MVTGLTGRLLEWEVLGSPLSCKQEYMPYQKAMALARQLSSGAPSTHVGKLLHSRVCATLEANASEVRMYSALGTPLDRFHGADGWFEFRDRRVTFDLTCNGHKDSYKADIIIHEYEFDDGDGISRLATQIARRLLSYSIRR